MNHIPRVAGPAWTESPLHHRWLTAESERLLVFFEGAVADERGGFSWLRADGTPDRDRPQDLYACARLVHCFALAHLMGRPGARDLALHGMSALSGAFHDDEHGGWFAAVHPDATPADTTKAGYAHAFVLLAGATATQAGLPGGRALLDEAAATIDRRFWREEEERRSTPTTGRGRPPRTIAGRTATCTSRRLTWPPPRPPVTRGSANAPCASAT